METKPTKGGFYMVTEEIVFDSLEDEKVLDDDEFKDTYGFFPDTSI